MVPELDLVYRDFGGWEPVEDVVLFSKLLLSRLHEISQNMVLLTKPVVTVYHSVYCIF